LLTENSSPRAHGFLSPWAQYSEGKNMKMYESYIRERLERSLYIKEGIGFATYTIYQDEVYIVDIFVEREFRRSNWASIFADDIVKIAKTKNCRTLKGSVDLSANGAEISIKTLLSYGMIPFSADRNFIIFKKAI
jgi:hypothetical protein